MGFGYKMKLGMEFPDKWKDKSKENGISLSDILYGCAIEDVMLRIYMSTYKESLWVANEDALGEEAYKKTSKDHLDLLYIEKEKKDEPFSQEFVECLLKTLFVKEDNKQEMLWNGKVNMFSENEAQISLTCEYMEMQVPLRVRIKAIKYERQIPKEKELTMLFNEKKGCKYLSYSRENLLSEVAFEIMRKLELISDMKAYDQMNDILKTQTINGRRVLDELKALGEKEPKVISMKRLEMLRSYADYGYMKKRWLQYVKKHPEKNEEWEKVMARLIAFFVPIWTALCENEIFFDDWMPELERFLG